MVRQQQADESTRKKTRIQQANEAKILDAALDVFSENGFRGATIDQIAERAGMSKPNLLYYFSGKDEIYRRVLDHTLDDWVRPLREIDPDGEPFAEIEGYVRRKLELAQARPRESRLFASEILHGADSIGPTLSGDLKTLVDRAASIINDWIAAGKLMPHDPRHLIFAIWATTQHYADFDVQVRAVLGQDDATRFADAEVLLVRLFRNGLRPDARDEG